MKASVPLAQKSSNRGYLLLNAKDLVKRFGALDAVTRKLNIFQEKEEEGPTEEEVREDVLRQLAQYPEIQSAFIPMLEDQLKEMEAAIPGAIKSHAELCVLEGKMFQAKLYLGMFKKFIEGE